MSDEKVEKMGSYKEEAVQALLMEKAKYAVERHVRDLKAMSGTVLVSIIGPRHPDGSRTVLVELRLVCNERPLILRPKLVPDDGRPA